MSKKFFSLFAAALLLPSFVLAYVNPGNPSGFVNDNAHLLSESERAQLEEKLVNFEKQTGNEIAIATIRSLDGDTIENFAEELFQEWQIGKKGQDNGILLLISKEDREMRIEVGYGLEPELTDLEASHLIQNVLVPAFREENYFAGMDEAITLIIQKLGGENSIAFAEPAPTPDFESYFVFGILGLAFLSRLFAQSRSWWLGGVLGGVAGVVVSFFFGLFNIGLISLFILIPLGLLIDFIFSRNGPGGGPGGLPGMGSWGSSSGWRSSGGGFGGFGGGSSGGGGASGRW